MPDNKIESTRNIEFDIGENCLRAILVIAAACCLCSFLRGCSASSVAHSQAIASPVAAPTQPLKP